MRQYAGFSTPEDTNERYHYLLDQGQTGLSMAFDLPTQMGYDSDDAMAAGEVGKAGVAIDSLSDMETVFDGIPLDEVSTSMTINAPASVLLAMYIAVGDEQGVDRAELRGTIQNDLLKEYIARNTYIYPPEPSMRIITDIFEFCAAETPKFNTISISGYHIREAGSTAAQELAFTLGNGIEYVEAAIDAGLDVDEFAPQLSFSSTVTTTSSRSREVPCRPPNVARHHGRALRRAKPQIQTAQIPHPDRRLDADRPTDREQRRPRRVSGACGGSGRHPESPHQRQRRGARTANGGIRPYGPANAADPRSRIRRGRHGRSLAGSYYVESLTDEVEADAYDILEAVDERGGMLEAADQQWVQRQIQDTAFDRQKEIESGERIIVGVNEFEVDEDPRWTSRKSPRTKDARSITSSPFARNATTRPSRRPSKRYARPPAATRT